MSNSAPKRTLIGRIGQITCPADRPSFSVSDVLTYVAFLWCLTMSHSAAGVPRTPDGQGGSGAPAGKHFDQWGDPFLQGAIARLGTVRFRYGTPIFSVAFSPSGSVLASIEFARSRKADVTKRGQWSYLESPDRWRCG